MATAAIFRRFRLVRPGKLEAGEDAFLYDIERLTGSDPTFEKDVIELNRTVKSNALAFWLEGARAMCGAVPFFRLGAPQNPQEKTVYVYTGSRGWASAGSPTNRRATKKSAAAVASTGSHWFRLVGAQVVPPL